MCGIWGFLSNIKCLKKNERKKLCDAFYNIKNRGPDRSRFLDLKEFLNLFLGFHRLAIMDKFTNGDQPFVLEMKNRTIYCLTNGEIYNFKHLKKKYDLKTQSSSDCEVIPLIYEKYGFEYLMKEINGEFAIALIDIFHDNKIINIKLARDPCGVRPLYYSIDESSFAFSSEMKGLLNIVDNKNIKQFPPGTYFEYDIFVDNNGKISKNQKMTQYFSFDFKMNFIKDLKMDDYFLGPIFKQVRKKFEKCVVEMMEADRPVGALLSGGLDSSLVVSILSKYLKERFGRILRTFSIGMPESTDEKYAKMVSKFCGTDHTHIEFTTKDFIDALHDVIYATETFDITTIRASVGQYLISKWISENTDVTVLYIGDGSDELCSGYMYFHKAPSPSESHIENSKLLQEIHLYDVLRADRGIATNGLEARVPFLNYRFVNFYMSIDPRLRVPVNGIEKWLLRKSFDPSVTTNAIEYLPKEVLWRKKEAFSDGVSSLKKSWYEIIQDMAEEKYSDDELTYAQYIYNHCSPTSKEALYFRKIFVDMFTDDTSHIIPHYWMPKWCGDIFEPSARILDVYESKSSKPLKLVEDV